MGGNLKPPQSSLAFITAFSEELTLLSLFQTNLTCLVSAEVCRKKFAVDIELN